MYTHSPEFWFQKRKNRENFRDFHENVMFYPHYKKKKKYKKLNVFNFEDLSTFLVSRIKLKNLVSVPP